MQHVLYIVDTGGKCIIWPHTALIEVFKVTKLCGAPCIIVMFTNIGTNPEPANCYLQSKKNQIEARERADTRLYVLAVGETN